MIRSTILLVLFTIIFAGCGRNASSPSSPQVANSAIPEEWKAPALPEKQQEQILGRAVELMKEAGHWQGYPLESIEFDEKRQQWRLEFSNGKPDEGYHVFIADEKADRIDILLFSPMWTEYERKETSNK